MSVVAPRGVDAASRRAGDVAGGSADAFEVERVGDSFFLRVGRSIPPRKLKLRSKRFPGLVLQWRAREPGEAVWDNSPERKLRVEAWKLGVLSALVAGVLYVEGLILAGVIARFLPFAWRITASLVGVVLLAGALFYWSLGVSMVSAAVRGEVVEDRGDGGGA